MAEKKYEKSDAQPKPILVFGVILGVVTVAAALLAALFLKQMQHRAEVNEPAPRYLGQPVILRPAPLLEVHPSRLYQELKAEEDETLSSYGWIDREKNIMRVPVSAAIRHLAGKMPSRSES